MSGKHCLKKGLPLFGLASDGVYLAGLVTKATGELLPHPFTLTLFEKKAVYSLLHLPSGYPAWSLTSILPCDVRTFLDSELPRQSNLAGASRAWLGSIKDFFALSQVVKYF